ncbi:enoyl-CoA hydratase-related protein [Comamonas flocculans]|uniref:Enoyl-CoA hydratase n=1 Tax=Comamonas flocculans TaxID=2597701 RepID=A0A5B8RTP0_9BURK|nr:enoyl-CoA hydratase-related protein [Comamonas flocculans]QEA12082.1 enoyl-CoA hydratase [Comamonas flocculans]
MHCFELGIDEGIAHLMLHRPEAFNTMGPRFWRELDEVLDTLHRGNGARVLLISSTGKHFSAGMALEVFDSALALDDASAAARAAIPEQLAELQHTFSRLESLRIPVIAAIQGGCVGGALDLVTAACLRYATRDAFFCVQEINIGMVADVGTLQRLPKLIPPGVAREMAYTGRRLPAERALALGLVNEVFDTQEAMLAAALQCAREIAAKPPVAVWASKQALNHARDHSVHDSLQQMGWLQGMVWSTAQVHEALRAHQEKRPGRFDPLAPLTRFTDGA